ncbi:endonuclease/exonuclease/phosphatase family protein [Stieleria sp. TO1_6]|uniref:endonuclease/exonuclease/phosphatase family protein n=1 Tax=Stieleria tagensis TaxID=2956795 RepID=UPI00209B1362|nr:endonuclease/exonuclease/phosphatase family protein [Stieleria tagensis]MCO8123148.1 endonuclease/exonuclease/phosphatase family protein [Stieleria tagensis]
MHVIFLLLIIALLCGSLLSLSSNPHWFVRGWDFPRVQIVAIAIAIYLLHRATDQWLAPSATPVSWAIGLLTLSLVVWHLCRIAPYTPLTPTQAKAFDPTGCQSTTLDDSHLRVLLSNVKLENDHYDRWCQVVRAAQPDILVALEVDEKWIQAIEPLIDEFPYQVLQPQDNWYGMMMLSRLPIESHQVCRVVQEDVPSIDALIRMKNGQKVRLVAVHPRPPEPIRDNDSTARDAELVLWGEELKQDLGPVIIGGDLNDVAWSQTTRLFLRTSGLLDPRRGRGLFSTFHADHWWMRFPLDHIFHSPHFTLRGLERLPHVGSDHFPILIDLQFQPERHYEHEVLEEKESDAEEAEERLERAEEDDQMKAEPIDHPQQQAATQ